MTTTERTGTQPTTTRADQISLVKFNLGQMEQGGKPIPATNELEKRLAELAEGRKVPLVTFNCLEVSWRPDQRRYPQSILTASLDTAVCRYNRDAIEIVQMELAQVGDPELSIIVPDSELTDARVFSFAQSEAERLTLASSFRKDLSLALFNSDDDQVKLWSDYCNQQGLRSPTDYTKENYDRIQREPDLLKKVRGQMKDSRKYLERSGLDKDYIASIRDDEAMERTSWYLAMYMGEGQVLRDSQAIVLNLEDGRVPAWFQRGARGSLPILTPVDATEFYRWRASQMNER